MKINVARTKIVRGDGWKGDEKGVIEQRDRAKRVAHRCQANEGRTGHGCLNGRGNQAGEAAITTVTGNRRKSVFTLPKCPARADERQLTIFDFEGNTSAIRE